MFSFFPREGLDILNFIAHSPPGVFVLCRAWLVSPGHAWSGFSHDSSMSLLACCEACYCYRSCMGMSHFPGLGMETHRFPVVGYISFYLCLP